VESGILGDLQFVPGLPNEYQENALRTRTMGAIGAALLEASRLTHLASKDRVWLRTCSKALATLSSKRNDLAHSRCVTDSLGQQRLMRFRKSGNGILIDDAWLANYRDTIATVMLTLPDDLRPAKRYGHI
jgi:hypothetical protein